MIYALAILTAACLAAIYIYWRSIEPIDLEEED